MAKSAKENKDFLMSSGNMLKQKRDSKDTTDFGKRNAENASQFQFFSYLTSKSKKTGRFGAKIAKEQDDIIKELEGSGVNVPESEEYFDPLGFRIIKPRTSEVLYAEDDVEMTEITEEQQAEMDKEDEEEAAKSKEEVQQPKEKVEETPISETQKVMDSFVQRVGDEISLNKENDFERGLAGEDARLAAINSVLEGDEADEVRQQKVENAAGTFNAGKGFEPDEPVVEEVPNAFEIELAVDDPPNRFSDAWERFKVDSEVGISSKINGVFRSVFRMSDPTKDELFMKFAKSLPRYKALDEMGKIEAKGSKKKYDPEKNTQLQSFVTELGEVVNAKHEGKSAVRMKAFRNGRILSQYSFSFGAMAGAGAEGAVTGVVTNPSKLSDKAVKTRFPISYSGFLKASARLRGVVGSMRTYSSIGYNATSFVADIAEAAGVPIKPEDTTQVLTTHKHRAQNVETPFKLATFIRNREERSRTRKDAIETFLEWEDYLAANHEKAMDQTADEQVQTNYAAFLDVDVIKQIRSKNLMTTDELKSMFEVLVKDMVRNFDRVDKIYPANGLEGDELEKVQKQREDEKILRFGYSTVQEFIEYYSRDENKILLAGLILGRGLKESEFRKLMSE